MRSYDGPAKLHRTIVELDLLAWVSLRISVSRVTTTGWTVVTRRCGHRIGKMASEDSRVLDLDQNVATCRLRKRIMHSRLPDDWLQKPAATQTYDTRRR